MVQYNRRNPCEACPFRENAAPGWLGDYSPEEVIDAIRHETPFPCHKEVEDLPFSGQADVDVAEMQAHANGYDMEDWRMHLDNINHCAGALIMAKKMSKLPREEKHKQAVKDAPADFPILFPPQKFIDYHTKQDPIDYVCDDLAQVHVSQEILKNQKIKVSNGLIPKPEDRDHFFLQRWGTESRGYTYCIAVHLAVSFDDRRNAFRYAQTKYLQNKQQQQMADLFNTYLAPRRNIKQEETKT